MKKKLTWLQGILLLVWLHDTDTLSSAGFLLDQNATHNRVGDAFTIIKPNKNEIVLIEPNS